MDKQRQVYVQNIGQYFLGDRIKNRRKDRELWQSVKYQNKKEKE